MTQATRNVRESVKRTTVIHYCPRTAEDQATYLAELAALGQSGTVESDGVIDVWGEDEAGNKWRLHVHTDWHRTP